MNSEKSTSNITFSDQLVSAEELATWLGLNERQVRKLAERSIINRDGRGRYRLKSAIQAATAHLRTVAAGRTSEDDTLDLVAERARLASEQADWQAMRNQQHRGGLVDVATACREVEAAFSRVRTRLLALPAEQAAALVRLKTPLAMQDSLYAMMVDLLTELSAPAAAGQVEAGVAPLS